jgi:hypothetical protein
MIYVIHVNVLDTRGSCIKNRTYVQLGATTSRGAKFRRRSADAVLPEHLSDRQPSLALLSRISTIWVSLNRDFRMAPSLGPAGESLRLSGLPGGGAYTAAAAVAVAL